MAFITGLTRGRREWTPKFVKRVDDEKCIGCEACGRTCSKKAFTFEPAAA
jgi:ferredoxin